MKKSQFDELVAEVEVLARVLNSLIHKLSEYNPRRNPHPYPPVNSLRYPDLSDAATRDIISPLVAHVCGELGIMPKDVMGYCRTARVAAARQWVFYEAHKRGATYAGIGRVMKRDHTTVIHGASKEAARRAMAGEK